MGSLIPLKGFSTWILIWHKSLIFLYIIWSGWIFQVCTCLASVGEQEMAGTRWHGGFPPSLHQKGCRGFLCLSNIIYPRFRLHTAVLVAG